MVYIRVQYDAYNRQFKIVDSELARTLRDGETYIVIADVSMEDPELNDPAPIQAEFNIVTA
jgi:hypothetical protein